MTWQAKEAFAGERTLPLTRGEYAICEHLALHAGQVFTKEQLYDAVFGFDAGGDPSAIAEHVKNIRAKLKAEGLSPVETVWGWGINGKKTAFCKSYLRSSALCRRYARLHAAVRPGMVALLYAASKRRYYLPGLRLQSTDGAGFWPKTQKPLFPQVRIFCPNMLCLPRKVTCWKAMWKERSWRL